MFPVMASKNFPTKSKCTVFLKRNSLPFLLPLSFPKSFQKKRADNPIIRPREESCSGRISFELDLAERKKKGGKNLKFLFRFPEKRTVYEKGGQGWMGQIKFCSPWKIGFLSVFPAQPAATKWSRQCGNEVHSGHGFWLAGNRFAFSFRPRPAFQNFSPQPEDTPPWLHTR